MNHSFKKNLWWINTALLALAFPNSSQAAEPRFSTSYHVTIQSRLAHHTFNPRDLASHRHTLNGSQTLKYGNDWSAVFGFRAYAEGAFAHNETRYGRPVRQNESYEISLRDFYIKYQGRSGSLRLGNQQVAWGEAFGFYYADIVNPKDLREFGLGDLSAQRIPVPMANAIIHLKKVSVQTLFIPKPYFSKQPSQGGDFSPSFQSFFPGTQIIVTDSRSRPASLGQGEYGIRASGLVNNLDLGVFFFSYFDRQPSYTVILTPGTPTVADFQANHKRIHTVGVTATQEISPFMARFEALYTRERQFDGIFNGQYGNYLSDQWTAAVELDYSLLAPWRFGLQLSEVYLSRFQAGSFQLRYQTQFSVNVKGPIWKQHQWQSILSYEANDGSSFAKFEYTIPTSHQFELVFGADLFLGGIQSKFGQIRRASRAYVILKGYLTK